MWGLVRIFISSFRNWPKASRKAKFSIIGDGGRIEELNAAVEDSQLQEVISIQPPIGRKDLIKRYMEADVLFLHLNAHEAFHKVLPSKIFEYASLGKPLLAGVSGFAATFLETELENAAVFPPMNIDAAAKAFEELALGNIPQRLGKNLLVAAFHRILRKEFLNSLLQVTSDLFDSQMLPQPGKHPRVLHGHISNHTCISSCVVFLGLLRPLALAGRLRIRPDHM